MAIFRKQHQVTVCSLLELLENYAFHCQIPPSPGFSELASVQQSCVFKLLVPRLRNLNNRSVDPCTAFEAGLYLLIGIPRETIILATDAELYREKIIKVFIQIALHILQSLSELNNTFAGSPVLTEDHSSMTMRSSIVISPFFPTFEFPRVLNRASSTVHHAELIPNADFSEVRWGSMRSTSGP